MIRRFIFCLFTLGSLSACNEYTTAICPSVGKSDFPKFEEEHVLRMYDSKGHEAVEGITKYQKVAVGTYLSDSGFKYLTCVVGGRRVVETYTIDTGTFSLQQVTDQPDGYELSFVGYNIRDLDAAKIPYKMLASTTALWKAFKSEARHLGVDRFIAFDGEDSPSRLVVDNQNLSDQAEFVKMGKPMGLQYRFYRAAP